MKKDDIISLVAQQAGIGFSEARAAVDTTYALLPKALIGCHELVLPGLGVLKLPNQATGPTITFTADRELIKAAEKMRKRG